MNEKKLKSVLLFGGSIFLIVFCLFPFVFMVVISLSHDPDFLSGKAFHLSLEHYRTILGHPSIHFKEFLRNSLMVSSASAFLSVGIAAFAAYALTRLRFPGKSFCLLGALAVSMFPQISLVSYLFNFMARLGLINTPLVLIGPYTAWSLPLCFWILTSYFAEIPTDLDEAALIDGCSRGQCLRKIIIPVALPGIFSAGLLAFIFAFNEFMLALMLTTDHHARTISVGIALFEGLHGQIPWGEIMAAASLTTLPLIILALGFQRGIIQGLTRGAIKG